MTRAAADKAYTNFINGLITEATGTTFPENALRELDNCDIELDGSIRRRAGIVCENESTPSFMQVKHSVEACTVHLWKQPGGSDDQNFVVVQVGSRLYVYDTVGDAIVNTPNLLAVITPASRDSTTVYITDTQAIAQEKMQSSNGLGRLWMTNSAVYPFYLEYDPTTNIVSSAKIGYAVGDTFFAGTQMQIRDFKGIYEAVDPGSKPAVLTGQHAYNLLNQGWNGATINAYAAAFPGQYPSNAEQWILGKDASDNFDPALLEKQDWGSGLIPKGRFFLQLVSGDRDNRPAADDVLIAPAPSGGMNFSGAYDEPMTSGFRGVAFACGRIWLSGNVTPKNPNGVYFSQTIQDIHDAAKFYQNNDPTSEHFPDLVATDGGVIYINEATRINHLQPFGQGVLVFAENGVWFIRGGVAGFTATEYTVDKLSAVGTCSPLSVVNAEQVVLFWHENTIWAVKPDPNGGPTPSVSDLSSGKIQQFINRIDVVAKREISGAYDPFTKKVFWLYLVSNSYQYPTNESLYNHALCLDLRTGAFTPYSFYARETDAYGVAGAISVPGQRTRPAFFQQVFTTGGGSVTVGGEQVVIYEDVSADAPQAACNLTFIIKLEGIAPAVSAFNAIYSARMRDLGFADFSIEKNDVLATPIAGTPFTSFFVTGDEHLGDLQRFKQATYVHSFFRKTEVGYMDDGAGNPVLKRPSGCTLVGEWDWHHTSTGHRWSASQQAYRFLKPYTPSGTTDPFDIGVSVVYTKLKVRGKGKALSLRYDSVGGKDFHCIGISVSFTGNAS